MTERKKTLLKEGTIRRFMKLAELDTLSSNFLNEYEEERDDEGRTPDEQAYADDEEEMGFEAGVEAAEEATPEDMVEELVGEIAAAVTKVTGIPVSVDGGEGEVEDVEAMGDLEDLAADEEVMDMAEPDLPGDELAEGEEDLEEDKDWGRKFINPDTGKHEYKREEGPGGVEHRAGEGPEGRFKRGTGHRGGKAREKSATHPGEEDFTTKKGRKKKTGDHGPAYEKQEESLRLDHVDLIDDEALVQEIAQRVAQRLMKK